VGLDGELRGGPAATSRHPPQRQPVQRHDVRLAGRLRRRQPYDREYAEQRQKWERLYEVTQYKGDGEAHPLLSPEDEFADFETWDFGNLDGTEAKTPEMLPGEYARSGLLRGLQLEAQLGVNPFKFG
jgi:hypothetical protein